jgi:hypothetical protein
MTEGYNKVQVVFSSTFIDTISSAEFQKSSSFNLYRDASSVVSWSEHGQEPDTHIW